MFDLVAHWVAFRQSLISVCTNTSPTANPAMFVQEVCYNAHGCCTESSSNLAMGSLATPRSRDVDGNSA